MAATHFVKGIMPGEFIIYTPEGDEDYHVGIKSVSLEPSPKANGHTLWVHLHDGRKVKVVIPQPILEHTDHLGNTW